MPGLSDGIHSSGEEPWLEEDVVRWAPVFPAPVQARICPGKFTWQTLALQGGDGGGQAHPAPAF